MILYKLEFKLTVEGFLVWKIKFFHAISTKSLTRLQMVVLDQKFKIGQKMTNSN